MTMFVWFQLKEVTWDTRRAYPPVRACLFSHHMTGITFLSDPSAGSGLPRGTIVYASQPIPAQVSSALSACAAHTRAGEQRPIARVQANHGPHQVLSCLVMSAAPQLNVHSFKVLVCISVCMYPCSLCA